MQKRPKKQAKGNTRNGKHALLRAKTLHKVQHGWGVISYRHPNPFQQMVHEWLFKSLDTYSNILKCSPISLPP